MASTQFKNIPFSNGSKKKRTAPPTRDEFDEASQDYIETKATRIVSPVAPQSSIKQFKLKRFQLPGQGLICSYSVVVDGLLFWLLWTFCNLLKYESSEQLLPWLNFVTSSGFQISLSLFSIAISSSWCLAQQRKLRDLESDLKSELEIKPSTIAALRHSLLLNDRVRNTSIVILIAYVLGGWR